MTRGALTTFSIANDVAKYFAIIPALFLAAYPATRGAERHGAALAESSAILSAVIFNALIISRADPARPPKGVAYSADRGGGAAAGATFSSTGSAASSCPFIGIKIIDLAVTSLHLHLRS